MRKRLVPAVCALLLGLASPLVWPAAPAPADSVSFSFGAVGDFGANSNTAATLTAMHNAAPDLTLALGDFSYSQVTPESAWCNFVKGYMGSTYPFELIAGNHDDNGPDGVISNFTACLPDRIGNLTGSYGKELTFTLSTTTP